MDYWYKQTGDSPLFEEILWSRPETKRGAGKLLIIGGNKYGFAAPAQAYQAADRAGAGHIRLVLPEALRKTVGPLGPYEFAPSNQSGSFGREALSELLMSSAWADGVLLAGDLGKNSETAIILEQFLMKYHGQLTITKDAVDYIYDLPQIIGSREQTTLVLSLAQLQKLGTALSFETPFLLSMGLMLLVRALHDFTLRYPLTIVTKELDSIVVAHQGKVSNTRLENDKDFWRVETAAKASVFWMQNKNRPFEAVTSSLI